MRSYLLCLALPVLALQSFAQEAAAPAPATPAPAPAPAAAPAPAPASLKKLTVLVKPAKPFAFEQDGKVEGFSVDLWRRIALEAGYESEFKVVPTVPEVIDALAAKKADVGVGALSITAEREEKVDFSHGFYSSGLRVLVQPKGQASIWSALSGVFTKEVFIVIAVLLGALLVNAHLLWFLERRKNPESFPEGYASGIWESLWWSICTIMTGGCENKAPIGVPGRLLAIIWMIGCIGLTSFITANLSATLTTDKLQSDIRGIDDLVRLPAKSTGAVKGTAPARFLERQKISAELFDTVDDACDALVAGKVRAVVHDAPLLRYYVSTHTGSNLELVGELREPQEYGFALPTGSTHRKEINRIRLQLTEQGFLQELDKKWFGDAQ